MIQHEAGGLSNSSRRPCTVSNRVRQNWFGTIDVELAVNSFRPFKSDPCVYVYEDETGFVVLTLYKLVHEGGRPGSSEVPRGADSPAPAAFPAGVDPNRGSEETVRSPGETVRSPGVL